MPADRRRAAAKVAAWGDLLDGLFTAEGQRLQEVTKRALNRPFACDRLAEAIADLDAKEDVYATRRGVFECAYVSSIDGAAQLYSVYVPPDYDPKRAYPLVLEQPAGSGWHHVRPKRQRLMQPSFIYARSSRRGPTGGEGLGELDALEIIRDVRANYHIDPDAIGVTGGSFGGRRV